MTLLQVTFKNLTLLTVISCVVACGLSLDRKGSSKNDTPTAITRTRFGTPLIFELADPDCNAAKAVADIGRIKVWLSVNNKMVQEEIDLGGFSGDQLKSESIGATFHSLAVNHITRTTITSGKPDRTSTHSEAIHNGTPLYFCRTDGEGYPRNSLENVALASAYGIAQAQRLHAKTFPDFKLAPITLLVHPRIANVTEVHDRNSQTLSSAEQVRTDNASWSRMSLGEYTAYFISVLPHSQEAFKPIFGKRALWETPAWFSHEYGHHIFYSHAPHAAASAWSSEHGHSHAEDHQPGLTQAVARALAGTAEEELPADHQPHTQTEPSMANGGQKLDAMAASAADGLNEGFADLVAFYSFRQTNQAHAKLSFGYLSRNRDVTTCQCDCMVMQKELNAEFVSYYFSGEKHQCIPGEPSANDPHSLGAIVAHGFHAVLELAHADLPSAIAEELSAQMLFTWAKRLDVLSAQNDYTGQGKTYLLDTIELFVKIVDASHAGLTSEQCKVIKQTFPALVDERPNVVATHCPN